MTLMNGWLWLIAALLLAAIELLAPGWVFMGLAAAVGTMGLVLLTGAWPLGLPLTLVATAVLSGIFWLLLRRLLGTGASPARIWHRDINDD